MPDPYTDPADDLRNALDLIREAVEQHAPLPASERFETAMHEGEAIVKAVHEIGGKPGRRVLRFTHDADFDEWDACSGGLHVARIYTDLNIDAETVWRWGLQDIHAGPDITEIGGTAGSLEEAKAAVYDAFRKWVAWAEL